MFPVKRKNIPQNNGKNRQKNHDMCVETLGNIGRKSKSQNINPNISQNEWDNQGFLRRKIERKKLTHINRITF